MPSPTAEPQLARWAWALPVAALALALLTAWADPAALRGLRHATFDQFQRWHPRPYGNPPVRIVDIDDESLHRLGQWPWPRDQMARLVDAINQSQPTMPHHGDAGSGLA